MCNNNHNNVNNSNNNNVSNNKNNADNNFFRNQSYILLNMNIQYKLINMRCLFNINVRYMFVTSGISLLRQWQYKYILHRRAIHNFPLHTFFIMTCEGFSQSQYRMLYLYIKNIFSAIVEPALANNILTFFLYSIYLLLNKLHKKIL